jgi:hypothetical protein
VNSSHLSGLCVFSDCKVFCLSSHIFVSVDQSLIRPHENTNQTHHVVLSIIVFSIAKAKRAKFTKYQATGVTTTHKHVCYVTKMDGWLKMSTSFVTIKQGQQSTDLKVSTSSFSNDKLLQRVDEILLNAEGLDPAYVKHLAEINVKPAQCPHRPAVHYTLSINTNS